MKTYNQLPYPFEQYAQNVNPSTRFSKPVRLIERVTTNPEEVIKEVFSEISPGDITEDLLPSWQRVAIINTASPYSERNGREMLNEFYDWLLRLAEALYIISERLPKIEPGHVTANQQANPTAMINEFFQLFTIEYTRRESCDLLDAGIGY